MRNTSQATKHNSKLTPIVISVLFALFMFMFFVFYFLPVQEKEYRERVFCSPQDDIYAAINTQHPEWIKEFRKSGGAPPNILFETTMGKKYEVNIEQWDHSASDPILSIVTHKAWQNRLGSKGYFYSPGKPPTGDGRTQIKYLDNDIYCYTFQ